MTGQRLSPASLERALGAWRPAAGRGGADNGASSRGTSAGPGGHAAEPLHRELAERLRLLILDGRIPLGARLPSERALAETLGLSRTTVASAYDHLRASGHARSRQGSGTVAASPGPAARAAAPHADEALIDLARASLPASPLVAPALRAAAEELPAFLTGTGYDLRGLPHLREAIATHYTRRGLPTGPEHIMVTLGAQHAIHLVASALLRPGDRALVESPTYPHAMAALRAAGARLITTPVTRGADGRQGGGAGENDGGYDVGHDGWDVGHLTQTLARLAPALAYLMPARHNPTGSSMSRATRAATLAAAQRSGTVLVIDETTTHLTTLGTAPADVFGDDTDATAARVTRASEAPTHPRGLGRRAASSVVHLGSLGKLFWGGLRVGWIRAEPELIERCVAARPTHDLGTPVLEQLAAARLLAQWDDAVAERSERLRASASALARLAAEHLPGWDVPGVDGGLSAWARLPLPASSALAIAAREHGVLVPAGPWFGTDGASFERFVRLPITLSVEELELAIPALGAAWDEVSGDRVRVAAPGRRSLELV